MKLYHDVNGAEDPCKAVDDESKLVFADLDQTFLVLLDILNRLCRVQSGSNWQLATTAMHHNYRLELPVAYRYWLLTTGAGSPSPLTLHDDVTTIYTTQSQRSSHWARRCRKLWSKYGCQTVR